MSRIAHLRLSRPYECSVQLGTVHNIRIQVWTVANLYLSAQIYTCINMKLTLRWGFDNHALRQVDNLINKVIRYVQRHETMLSKYTLILSLVNGLWLFRKESSGVMFILSPPAVLILAKWFHDGIVFERTWNECLAVDWLFKMLWFALYFYTLELYCQFLINVWWYNMITMIF